MLVVMEERVLFLLLQGQALLAQGAGVALGELRKVLVVLVGALMPLLLLQIMVLSIQVVAGVAVRILEMAALAAPASSSFA
jgi:hypothetical protein